jgi:hypothetical protein
MIAIRIARPVHEELALRVRGAVVGAERGGHGMAVAK